MALQWLESGQRSWMGVFVKRKSWGKLSFGRVALGVFVQPLRCNSGVELIQVNVG